MGKMSEPTPATSAIVLTCFAMLLGAVCAYSTVATAQFDAKFHVMAGADWVFIGNRGGFLDFSQSDRGDLAQDVSSQGVCYEPGLR